MPNEEPTGPDGTPGQEEGDNITPAIAVVHMLAESARAFSLIQGSQAEALTQQCLDLASMGLAKAVQEISEAENR
tara:strand:+ start:933 stop:1157 length:225 start_codon:yes stop_codon:yes gene_type:complete